MNSKKPRGFALVSATVLLGVIVTLGMAMLSYSLAGRRVGKALQVTTTATHIAEAGLNKAIMCLNASSGTNCGGTSGAGFVGQSNVSFGGGTFTTTLAGGGSTRTITAVGQAPSGETVTIVADATTIPSTTDTSFSYALQSGSGGAHMENNSSITGSIYSGGDIDCTSSTNAVITGDAYSSKVGGKIDNCKVTFHAHADKVLSSKVLGDAYYQNNPADIAGTNVTGTKYPNSATPTAAELPQFDLDYWHTAAEDGGIIAGNYSPTDNSSLGPIKIAGDLTMGNNVDLNVTGPIWVEGDIITGNNSSFTLDAAFGAYSTVILADDPSNQATKGKIDITNNTGISGSGNAQSHIMFATTNSSTVDASPALSVANNASGAVFYAMNGVMRLQNNAGAKSLAGYRLFIDQNAIVTYVQSDFSGFFSASPAGTWHLVKGSWRRTQ